MSEGSHCLRCDAPILPDTASGGHCPRCLAELGFLPTTKIPTEFLPTTIGATDLSIAPGQRLGSYEILSLLGKGGMGEVYRARDNKLNREVAIKVLPREFSNDAERVARFHREAQSIAALNHPNIAAIYEFSEANATRFLVLELVEGETLAERLSRGALSTAEAIHIAKQILEALEAAYEKGIVHRDLKPANVKITPDGKAKVLDFGLAKAGKDSLNPSATNPGVILGTVAYMSPEQAKGFAVDHRSDLFSFGCVFYEALTGRQAFAGETPSETLASVLRTEPDFSLLPPKLNPRIVELLRRCFAKSPKNRWHTAADLRAELEASVNTGELPSQVAVQWRSRSGWKRAIVIVVGLMFLGGAVGGFVRWRTQRTEPRAVSRFSITVPTAALTNFSTRVIGISRDGTQIVYQTNQKLLLRTISDFDAMPIAGAEDTIATTSPAFSPDGRSIVYWSTARGNLMTIPTSGGTPVSVAPVDAFGVFGVAWTADGIVFGQGRQRIERVVATGGKSAVLLAKSDDGETVAFPKVLPGGRAVLFSVAKNNRVQIAVQSLDSGARTILMERRLDASLDNAVPIDAYYAPTGHLLYAQGGTIFAVPLDLAQLKLTGTPAPVITGVRRALSNELEISFSDNGTLAYIPGPETGVAKFDLGLADRNGVVQPLKLPPRRYQTPRVSPDGKRVAFAIDDDPDSDIWLYDFDRANAPNRLTFGGKNRFPVWSPDGQWIAFQSDRDGDAGIFRQRANGAGVAERLTKSERGIAHVPESWSPKADVLLFRKVEGTNNFSLWSFTIGERISAPFGEVKSVDPPNAVFSPDGRWVAYNMREPGQTSEEVYVQPFPATGARYQLPISRDNHHPAWSRDGKQLFYVPGPDEFAKVAVTTTPTFTFGNQTAIRQVLENYAPTVPRQYDVTADGRLIGLIPAGADAPVQINVILNWFEELKHLAPVR
jgi:serine/threonine protein kinase